MLALLSSALHAQLGDGGIEGTVTDRTGAVIRGAKVIATNLDTGVQTIRQTTGAGTYSISPLQAGHYNIEVVATGFARLLQEDVTVDALQRVGLNLKLSIGTNTQTVTVTDAPAMLDTTDASLGGTIENELYTELPLSMGGAPRDPTAFAFLMPGVQEGTGRGTYGGSGQENLNENYLDGMPVTNISQQGDNSPISKAVSVDAVDQFQVKTNGASTAFGGAGVSNYTIKSGGNQFHGTVFDYIRNTAFDTWGYFSKVPAANGYAIKPGEHQNSWGGSLGGPIIKDKLFFFGTYEGFHYTKVSNTPQYITLPTMRERQGDFTDQFGTATAGIYDPTSGSGVVTARNAFQGILNGVPTNNVIPASMISSISQYLQSALPTPTNMATSDNYLAGLPLENDDYTIDSRIDYTVSPRHKFSIVGVGGNRGYGSIPDYTGSTPYQQLPEPYASAILTNQKTASGVVTYTFVASQRIVNSLKYGFSRTWGESFSPTSNTKYTGAAAGINNLPGGNASSTFPAINFAQQNVAGVLAPAAWAANGNSGPGGTNTFTLIDNLQWIKGRHDITFGIQIQWLQTNGATYGGPSNTAEFNYSSYETQGGSPNPSLGTPYASFLVGAVDYSRVEVQSISDVGGRYHPVAPYVQDNWRVRPNLTLNIGLRYDYLQPYHEAHNRIAFLDTKTINPIVGIPGVLTYAGYGKGADGTTDFVCQCSTPVHPYNKNFEPRLGFAYSVNQSTVIRGNFGIMTTHAGGVGGRAGATTGTGTNAYSSTTVWTKPNSQSAPMFFLNPGLPVTPTETAGPGNPQMDTSSIPQWTPAGYFFNPLSATGNYTADANNTYNCVLPTASSYCSPQPVDYADPYYGGRGPQFVNYNLGFERMINKKAVLSVNYVGSQTHFLAGGGSRGFATNTISPDYAQLLTTSLSESAATNLTAVQALLPSFKLPYPTFQGTQATVRQALSPFPQFLNNTDLWGQTGNSMYNALQISVVQRPWHNLSGFVNFTWSKEMDDTHGHRSEYPIGPADGNFTKQFLGDRVDRSLGTFNQPYAFNATWVYGFPIGRGQTFFANNRLISAIGGGWQLSGIYKIRAGTPLAITLSGGCETATNAGQGTCYPDYAAGFNKKNMRINGKWGRGPGATASNIQNIQYLNPSAFVCPDSGPSDPNHTCGTTNGSTGAAGDYTGAQFNPTWKIGNITNSGAYGVTGPGYWDLDLGIRRIFNIRETTNEHLTFQVEADVINVTNSTFFTLATGGTGWNVCQPGQTYLTCGVAAYGTIGGQNSSVPPRDWQFAGRFRF
jgi:hypothetical protein